MRKVLLAAAIVVLGLTAVMNASAASHHQVLGRTAARFDAHGAPYGLAVDCTLNSANLCAGWIWTYTVQPTGAVWGAVMNPSDCPISCTNGGAVEQFILYSRCSTTPGSFGGLSIWPVDGVDCRTGTSALYDTGPMTVTHCVSGDRWTTVATTRQVHVNGNPFAVCITWTETAGANNPQFATDNGIADLYCHQNPTAFPVFPGCGTSGAPCASWSIPPQRTFIYVTDLNGDTVLDDICALYGAPYALAFPYVYPYGYLPNNLIVSVGLDCFSPTATESGSWGHVKSLYQ